MDAHQRAMTNKNFKDLTGQVFRTYKALRYLGSSTWECVCIECGAISRQYSFRLLGGTNTCKHNRRVTPEEAIRIIEMREAKHTWKAISEAVGHKISTCISVAAPYVERKYTKETPQAAKTRKLCGDCKHWGVNEIKSVPHPTRVRQQESYCDKQSMFVWRCEWACDNYNK